MAIADLDPRVGNEVFHAVRSRRFLQADGRVSTQMFLLRPTDTDGLSVNIESARSCVGTLTVHGVASLAVPPIYDLGLEILIDEAPHAYLKGMVQQTENPGLAEYHASRLADIANLVSEADWR